MISPIPTNEDIAAAEKAVEVTKAEYDACDAAGLCTTEALIEHRCAIEAFMDLKWRREQAILSEAGVCSI